MEGVEERLRLAITNTLGMDGSDAGFDSGEMRRHASTARTRLNAFRAGNGAADLNSLTAELVAAFNDLLASF